MLTFWWICLLSLLPLCLIFQFVWNKIPNRIQYRLLKSPFDCLLACAQNEKRQVEVVSNFYCTFFCISFNVKWNIKLKRACHSFSHKFHSLNLQGKLYGRLMLDDFSSFSLFLWNFSFSRNLEKCQFSIYQEQRKQKHKRHTQRGEKLNQQTFVFIIVSCATMTFFYLNVNSARD